MGKFDWEENEILEINLICYSLLKLFHCCGVYSIDRLIVFWGGIDLLYCVLNLAELVL